MRPNAILTFLVGSFDPGAVKRLRGQIDSIPYNNSRVLVSRALHGLSISEVPEEIAAWQLSRNALAHAKEDDSSSQESLDQYKAFLNLLYKPVLGVFGYKGPRVDIGPASLQGVRLTEWNSK